MVKFDHENLSIFKSTRGVAARRRGGCQRVAVVAMMVSLQVQRLLAVRKCIVCGLLALCCVCLPAAQCIALAEGRQFNTASGGGLISQGVTGDGAVQASPLPPASQRGRTRLVHLTHLYLRGGRTATPSPKNTSLLSARNRKRPDDMKPEQRVVTLKRAAGKVPKIGTEKEEGVEPEPAGGAKRRRGKAGAAGKKEAVQLRVREEPRQAK